MTDGHTTANYQQPRGKRPEEAVRDYERELAERRATAAGPRVPITPELERKLAAAIVRGADDFPFFCRAIVGVRVHGGQRETVELIAAHMLTCLACSNGWGKTTFIALLLLWASFYRKWADKYWTVYRAMALGPTMEQAYLIHAEIEALRLNQHKAQVWDEKEHLFLLADKLVPFKDNKREAFKWDLPGRRPSQIVFNTSKDRGAQLEGKAPNIVAFDEVRLERHLDYVVHQVLLPRGLRVPGFKLILSSTPTKDSYDYHELFKKGEAREPGYASRKGSIYENEFLTEQQIAEIAAKLDERVRRQVLMGEFVEPPDSFFIKERVEACFDPPPTPPDLEEWQGKFVRGRRYIGGIDPAVSEGGDESVVTVWDVEEIPHRVIYHRALPKGTPTDRLISITDEMIAASGQTLIFGYDASGPLGIVLTQQIGRYPANYVPIKFNAQKSAVDPLVTTKQEHLAVFQHYVNQRLWRSPHHTRLLAQICAYRLSDRQLKTDHLMAQVYAAAIAKDFLPSGAAEGLYLPMTGPVYEAGPFGDYDVETKTPMQRRWIELGQAGRRAPEAA